MRKRRTTTKRRLKIINKNVNVNNIIIGRTRTTTAQKRATPARLFSLGYINTTPNGELLDLSRRLMQLEFTRKAEQNNANGVAVGITGLINTEKKNKPEEVLPPLEAFASPLQQTLLKDEEMIKAPSKSIGFSNDNYSNQTQINYNSLLSETKPLNLTRELNKQKINDIMKRETTPIKERLRKNPKQKVYDL
jgi:hypothetical protein